MSLSATTLLCLLALPPLQGAFQEAGVETVTLVEGQSLDLDCTVAGGRSSVFEWKNPRWFVIFFQGLRGLKDQRYKLVHYSKDNLRIRLSHVTTEDEGLYTCFRNGVPVKRKQVNVLGDTKHQLQGRGKKYNSTSTLTVHTYSQKSAVTCVVRHKSLRGGNLTTSFHLDRVGSGEILSRTEGRSHSEKPSPRYETATPNYSSTTHGTDLTYEEMVERTPNVLLPVLVSVMLTALFIAVLLFAVKLWKAHKVWKKESEASEQTLENNRPRTNEDSLDQEKKIHAACWKVSKMYVIQKSCTKASKDSEESQDSSVFEKQLPYVKETDL
ncbi:hypothetical protein lerEdw1_007599 [Lerista edwardsae]|nr:hypothetical protein lerEdw1_007599 [Lerista edwardsae]